MHTGVFARPETCAMRSRSVASLCVRRHRPIVVAHDDDDDDVVVAVDAKLGEYSNNDSRIRFCARYTTRNLARITNSNPE